MMIVATAEIMNVHLRPIASARKPMDASEAREPNRRIAAQQAHKPPVTRE